MTRLIGLDAAADLHRFGYCVCAYRHPALVHVRSGCIDSFAALRELAREHLDGAHSALLCIDAPLGWPVKMTEALRAHQAGEAIVADPEKLFSRETDRHIRQRLGKRPLEVGADRIARTAWSALQVLDEIRMTVGEAIPLAWHPAFPQRIAAIEVYPAATLVACGLPATGYKDAVTGRASRDAIASHFVELAPWLPGLAGGSVDAFDAALCAIAGVDFISGSAIAPTDMDLAVKEGWIWARDPTLTERQNPS